MFKYSKFLKFATKCISSKENLKTRIQYLEVNSNISEKTHYDNLLLSLEKQDFSSFNKKFLFCKTNKIVFENEKINRLFHLLNERKLNISIMDNLNDYLIENDIVLDSIGYSFLINYYLKFKGFAYGYNIFLLAKLNEVKLDLSVYYSLYDYLERARNNYKLTFGARNYLLNSLKKDFDKETIEFFENSIIAIQEKILQKIRGKDLLKRNSKHNKVNSGENREVLIEKLDKKDDIIEIKNYQLKDKEKFQIESQLREELDKNEFDEIDSYKRDTIIEELKMNLNYNLDWSKLKTNNLKEILLLLRLISKMNTHEDLEINEKDSLNDLDRIILLKMTNPENEDNNNNLNKGRNINDDDSSDDE